MPKFGLEMLGDAEVDEEEKRRRDLAEDIRPWNGTVIFIVSRINKYNY